MKYFMYKDDQPIGPIDRSQVIAMLVSGEMAGTDLICQEGNTEWVPAVTVLRNVPAPQMPSAAAAPPVPPPATNTNLDREWELYEAYSNEIGGLTDLLGEVDERQAKEIHNQIAHKLEISYKHIAAVEPQFPHSLEVKSMKADYLFNCAVKKMWEHGFYHRATDKVLARGERKGTTFTGLGVATATRLIANRQEKANATEALKLLSQSLGFLDAAGTRLVKANVHNALGQKDAALQELNVIITQFQDDDTYIAARQLQDEIITPPKKGMCFVATAACGDYRAPEVVFLSRFRDEVLRQSRGGRWFIALYYRMSPPVSSVIADSIVLRQLVRKAFIRPLVFVLQKTLKTGDT